MHAAYRCSDNMFAMCWVTVWCACWDCADNTLSCSDEPSNNDAVQMHLHVRSFSSPPKILSCSCSTICLNLYDATSCAPAVSQSAVQLYQNSVIIGSRKSLLNPVIMSNAHSISVSRSLVVETSKGWGHCRHC